ncbi:MAG: XRE family transcriptional regulator [Acidobacteria bacterium]|nr:MAG: XRE family transcriptional regulator [Acidobacteriota bacterium]REJ98073.1 MAG: XRE family transcriptional regulator [Acidobacteriota bacterium]REK16816.1 MAG: XRE family transcriptional regulator [Acidobacteriota bacterium]REK42727.1 MAG: XRE family transcriptional regulator [Acidobacteriota bacterium]
MSNAIKRGSGNVFEDLGFENPSEHRVKADLALRIIKIVEERKLTQAKAAILIGATQPDVSKLKSGQLKGFTLDRLFSFLLKLDRSIEIRITKPRNKKKRGILETVGG